MKYIAITLLAGALTTLALADEAPKSPCEKPTMPNAQSSDAVVKYFNKHMITYKVCTDKFVEEQRAIAKQLTDTAKANQAFEAAEAAQKEYNAMVDELNARTPAEY